MGHHGDLRPGGPASIGPLEISFFRCIITGLVFLAFLAVTKPSALRVSGKGLLICILYGAVAYSLSFTTYSLAVIRSPWRWPPS